MGAGVGFGVGAGVDVGFCLEDGVGAVSDVEAGFGLEVEAVEAVGFEVGAGAETLAGSVSEFVSVFTDDVLLPFVVLPLPDFLLSPVFIGCSFLTSVPDAAGRGESSSCFSGVLPVSFSSA